MFAYGTLKTTQKRIYVIALPSWIFHDLEGTKVPFKQSVRSLEHNFGPIRVFLILRWTEVRTNHRNERDRKDSLSTQFGRLRSWYAFRMQWGPYGDWNRREDRLGHQDHQDHQDRREDRLGHQDHQDHQDRREDRLGHQDHQDHQDRREDRLGHQDHQEDHMEDILGGHREDRLEDHMEDILGDHREDRLEAHREDRLEDHMEDTLGDHREEGPTRDPPGKTLSESLRSRRDVNRWVHPGPTL
ncbi:hypothetical protein CIHG_00184 [Coccidioides immitis H538.4]|uniref:Uncharacterized protein n=1 Tax=Coccidioides immitis H538.4 TaxID=396776 RepID=A0A0J8RCZ1_COCIT|nr:hypothetical protein CIHG_00184 [Coccidioides immitis H538.4]